MVRSSSSAAAVDEAVRAVRASSRRRQVLDAAVQVMQRTGFYQMSMQALADEADVSVGLIYKYFGGKEEILLATIVDILEAFRDQLEPVMQPIGDPVERFVAGFRRYCEIVDENLDAVALTYRESRTLDHAGRDRIKTLEIATAQPLRTAVQDGIAASTMNPVDVDLFVSDAMMLSHGWALKHWHFRTHYTLDTYARAQTTMLLRSLLTDSARKNYDYLME